MENTIHDEVTERGALPVPEALALAWAVHGLRGLESLHAIGLPAARVMLPGSTLQAPSPSDLPRSPALHALLRLAEDEHRLTPQVDVSGEAKRGSLGRGAVADEILVAEALRWIDVAPAVRQRRRSAGGLQVEVRQTSA